MTRPGVRGGRSAIGIERALGVLPPLARGGLPVGVGVDAVHRAHRREALATPAAELGDDDHVDAVVEDRSELRRTMADAATVSIGFAFRVAASLAFVRNMTFALISGSTRLS